MCTFIIIVKNFFDLLITLAFWKYIQKANFKNVKFLKTHGFS